MQKDILDLRLKDDEGESTWGISPTGNVIVLPYVVRLLPHC